MPICFAAGVSCIHLEAEIESQTEPHSPGKLLEVVHLFKFNFWAVASGFIHRKQYERPTPSETLNFLSTDYSMPMESWNYLVGRRSLWSGGLWSGFPNANLVLLKYAVAVEGDGHLLFSKG